MKNRWIALYVENQVGVLAKVSGLFSGKSYNLQSLTVGTTEDETVSRMTICVTSDDITFEQIQKERDEVLSADCEQVRAAAKMVSVVLHDGYICAIGSEGKVEDAKELFNEIRVLN